MKIKVKKINHPILVHSIYNWKPLSWDALWVYHPCIVFYQNKYYMLYTGKGIGRGINHSIGLAISNNLRIWKKNKENPVFWEGEQGVWDSDFVAHGYVFRKGSMFYMLYDGSKKENWLEEIGIAKSKDLIHWEKYGKNPIFKIGSEWWENHHVSRACIFRANGWSYLYYAGHDGTRERIGIARDKTGFSFKRFLKEPVLDVGKKGDWDEKSISDPKIITYKNTYLMLYSGMDRKGFERIGMAISRNLTRWKKYEGNPILDVAENGWDKISAARADIKKINGAYCLFYSGRKNYFYDIGMAKMEIT